MSKTRIKKGQLLQKTGQINTKIYLVKSGLLRSYAIDQKGKEHIFMFAPEDWIMTDSTPPNKSCELYIDALEDSEIMVIEKGKEDEIDLQKILNRLNTLQQRIMMMMSATAIERYKHFIDTYPNITQRVSQRMIASYLGITPEALSKVKGKQKRKTI
ncbi:Crp/Fnr family transcriptional regulator [Aquimarina algicola]|uniref:Crp/Fnr family transcriptional regulator n=1 Tax=Aquimarina algicola TaxID=2589995 RepID=A0A504JC82_9FLAO|nr:Crp/Fnr family transcriptional regulator [Aquimarina algicola]TPN85183.1 Crp/Fnr family transcriptional regulator [Aquimarina algicola]